MHKIEGIYGQNDHRSVQDVEINLGPNNSSSPSIAQLNCTIYCPNEQARRVKRQSQTHHLDVTVKESMRGVPTVQSDWASLEIPDKKFRCTSGVDGNGDELEYDTPKHDVATRSGVSAVGYRGGCQAASETLYNQRDNITCAKDNRVPLRRKAAVRRTKPLDDHSENNKVGSKEGSRANNRRANLQLERRI